MVDDGADVSLRTLMRDGVVVAPGCYDVFSALLAKRVGFNAIYMGGAWITASTFGRPDIGWMDRSDLVASVHRVYQATRLPVIVDGDAGYGGLVGVYRLVTELEAAGAAGVHFEDSAEPKSASAELVSIDAMCTRIRAAISARDKPGFLIIARTDARTKQGVDAVVERAVAYASAGADLVFPNWLESELEVQAVAERVQCPLMLQISEGGSTPEMDPVRAAALKVRLIVYPGGTLRAAGAAAEQYLLALRGHAKKPPLLDYATRSRLTGLEEFAHWESLQMTTSRSKATDLAGSDETARAPLGDISV